MLQGNVAKDKSTAKTLMIINVIIEKQTGTNDVYFYERYQRFF